MSVDPAITRLILKEEVKGMSSLAEAYSWEVVPDFNTLIVSVRMSSAIDQQMFIVEACCDNYKEMPPYFDFIHPETGERGTKRCYPAGGNYFHSMPCICVQWNRKAYKSENGPHQDWNMGNWIQARPGTRTLGDMFHLIQKEVNQRGQYRGRMA